MNADKPLTCPTCGTPARIVSADEGTSYYYQPIAQPDVEALRTAARVAVERFYNAEDADDDASLLDAMRELRRFWTWYGGHITGIAALDRLDR